MRAEGTGSGSVWQIYFTQTQNTDNKGVVISGKSSLKHSHNPASVNMKHRVQEVAKVMETAHGAKA